MLSPCGVHGSNLCGYESAIVSHLALLLDTEPGSRCAPRRCDPLGAACVECFEKEKSRKLAVRGWVGPLEVAKGPLVAHNGATVLGGGCLSLSLFPSVRV